MSFHFARSEEWLLGGQDSMQINSEWLWDIRGDPGQFTRADVHLRWLKEESTI